MDIFCCDIHSLEIICERSIKCRDFLKLIRHIKMIGFLLNSTLYNLRKLNDIICIIVNKHVNIRKLHNQELHCNQL